MDTTSLYFESIPPGAREIQTVAVTFKEPLTLRGSEAALRVEYQAKGDSATLDYVGKAFLDHDLVVLSHEEYQSKMDLHLFEWFLYLLLTLGGGIGMPLYQLFRLRNLSKVE